MKPYLSWYYSFCCILFTGCLTAQTNRTDVSLHKNGVIKDTSKNVILITLDGVRWQEFFHDVDPELSEGIPNISLFKNLKQRLSVSGIVVGDRQAGSEMVVSNSSLISLPAYQSMMTGYTQDCTSNSCSRVPVETLQEQILKDLKLDKEQVATFASWSKIPLAVEHQEGNTLVNAGFTKLEDKLADGELGLLNYAQFDEDPFGDEARVDEYTFQLALWYLKKHRPRFLYISLNDSDEFGHKNKYLKYIERLQQYDEWIENLYKTLEGLDEYGKSTIIMITTDHGRGDHGDWTDHGGSVPESKYIWFAALGPSLKSKITTQATYQHNDLVPTIQEIMTGSYQTCDVCGNPMKELVSQIK